MAGYAVQIDSLVSSALDGMAQHAKGTMGRVRLGTSATACIFLLVGIKLASQAVEKGQSLKVVGTAIQGFPNYVIAQRAQYLASGLTASSPLAAKAAFLKHKTVAVNDIGGSSGEFARYALGAGSIPVSEVTLINMTSTAGRLAALKRGRIDAIVGGQPEPETAQAGGYGVMPINPKVDLPGLNRLDYMVQVVREDYLKQNPGIVERYLRGIRRSEDLIRSHPDDAKQAFFRVRVERDAWRTDRSENRRRSLEKHAVVFPFDIAAGARRCCRSTKILWHLAGRSRRQADR